MIWPQKNIQKKQDEIAPVLLEGPRVCMRPPKLSDAQEWQVVRSRNRAYLQPFEPTWDENCLNTDYFHRRWARQKYEWDHGTAHALLIFKKQDKSLIGGMNINHVCRGAGQYASLGYWIDETHQGQGYMAESLHLTLKFAFVDLDLHRVHASCILKNTRSKNLLTRSGFKEEGYAEKYIAIDGQWQDHHLFGITIEDWRRSGVAGGV
jgi:[ribosomal protein S5]-alanine N-acetyltransferase